ncbi:MAG: NAD(P)/FAD-dependent oxidoreductase [Archangiaceae bacterium]|nr:NAD(P)/FAD-dependent oxidoreductase [Archangiaceae bacterium]
MTTNLRRPPTNFIDPDAIIIGSGLGGLALASTLAQKRGLKVLVLEAAPMAGGATHVHEVQGYEFPAGLHSVGDMDTDINPAALNAWTANYVTGNQVTWSKMPEDHEYAFLGDEGFPWYSTAEENIESMSKRGLGAGDLAGYFKLENEVQAAGAGWALTKLYPNALPLAVREGIYRLTAKTWRKYMQRDTHRVLKQDLGFSDKMAGLFEYMYGNYGRPPDEAPFTMHAAVMYHYRKGAYFPAGGPSVLAKTINTVLEACGGQIATSTPVDQILVENDRAVGVRLKNGTELRAKIVVSDASAWTTFMQLMPREVSERHGYVSKLKTIGSSPSHITLMAGWNENIDLPAHIVWQMPRFPELQPWDVAAGDRIYKSQMRFEGMPAYLMSPSARDPLYGERCPGKTSMMLLVEANREWTLRAASEPGFRAELEGKFKEHALKLMTDRFPQLATRAPSMLHVQWPMGCNPHAREGGSYGLEPSAARFLEHTHWLRPKTTIENFFLVGQDAFMPGIAGVLIGSRFAYTAITGDLLHLVNKDVSQFRPQLPVSAPNEAPDLKVA